LFSKILLRKFLNSRLRQVTDPLLSTLIGIMALSALWSGCDKEHLAGSLTVRHVAEGSYEIYKLASEQPLQFVSETSSQFNDKVMLTPGSYMVLADCSSEIVNIYPGSDITLVAHRVHFVPLQPPGDQDKFSIQCLRSEKTRSRQNLKNHFSLAILAGTRELLVGMIPLRLDLTAASAPDGSPDSRVVSHVLSSISVAAKGRPPLDDFFVSPVGGVTPFTENQQPGAKLFVLKGTYDVQLNGTETTVTLGEGESRNIQPGSLMVSTSPNADITRAEQIRGAPLFAEINGEHYMNLNTAYPVLPGKLSVRLATSLRPQEFEISEGESLDLHARNIVVDLGCEKDDWACLGSRKVRLFEKDKNYHFAESQTDIPVLFFEKDVAVGIEGSRNIKMNLNAADDQRAKVGFLEVIPTPTHKPGILTDLMRVEPSGGSMIGASLDMTLDKPTVMPLLAGQYHLAQYTFFTSDGSRRKTSQSVYIGPGQRLRIEVQTFLSEKRMAAITGDSDDASRQ
jgi:hypothetical protein